MRLAGVRNWFQGSSIPDAVIASLTAIAPYAVPDGPLHAPLVHAPLVHAPLVDAPSRSAVQPLWTDARIAMAEGLWGEGFLLPGGESEVLRLVRPLGLPAAASLLLVGAQAAGPAIAIARQLGVWVSGFESDPILAALGTERAQKSGLGTRVQVESWNPDEPIFQAGAYHHGLALEPLHNLAIESTRGGRVEPVLAAIGGALKPGGQFMLLETVADTKLAPDDTESLAWARLENRRLDLPSEASITRVLGRLGFDVRVVEDLSQRHAHLAVLGWRDAVRRMREDRPSPGQSALLVREAELWFYRIRMLRAGRLRLLRWHAIRRGGPAGSSHILP